MTPHPTDTAQLGVMCRFVEGAFNYTVYIIDEEIGEQIIWCSEYSENLVLYVIKYLK